MLRQALHRSLGVPRDLLGDGELHSFSFDCEAESARSAELFGKKGSRRGLEQ
jgi:hypothetical protein